MLFATLALAMSAGTAAALRSISITAEGRGETVEDRAGTTFRDGVETIRCNMRLVFTTRPAIAKVAGSAIGQFNEVITEGCMGGTVTELLENLPWRIRYESFAGALPNITELHLKIANFEVEVDSAGGLSRCLYAGEPRIITSGNPWTMDSFDTRVTIPVVRGSGMLRCSAALTIEGTYRLSRAIRLILI
jgi:hypothetical protein